MNSVESSSSTCRICLQNNATYPIFDESISEVGILLQMNKCFMEKIEDVEGYPRYICSACKITLDMLCEFIDKYRESCRVLRESLAQMKTEVEDSFTENDDDFFWYDKEYVVIKVENGTEKENICNFSKVIDKLKPLPDLEITKVESKKCLKRNDSVATRRKTKNSKLDSSIFEGESNCNGVICDFCKAVFDKNDKLRQHIRSKHKSTPVTCKICSQIYRSNESLKKHYKKCHTDSHSSVLCDHCGAVFEKKDKLQAHIRTKHKSTPEICRICSKTYPSAACLRRHNKRFHGEKTLQCEQCPIKFPTIGQLNEHIKAVHKRLKRKIFQCKFCDKTFKSYYCHVAHERAVHTGLRPAVCKVCDKAFYHTVYLKEHMRQHTGNLPYKCPFCDRACTIRGNLKSHLRTHKKSELNDAILSKMKPEVILSF